MRTPLALLAIALLSACTSREGTNSASATGSTGGTLIIAPVADANDVFPVFVNDLTGRVIQDQVFDRLAEIDSSLNTVGDKSFAPRLAKSWTWAPDSMSIAFSLDPRAKWHDGKPVTASDVRYSFLAFTDSIIGSPTRPLLSNIDSVSIRDSLTPVVWFKKRTPEQFYDIAYQLIVMPEHIYGSIPAKELHSSPLIRTPIGSGRFRFVRWEPGTRLELISDTSNFRGRAKLDRVIFTPTQAQTAAAQLLAGETDFVEAFPTGLVPQLENSPVARSVSVPIQAYVFLAFNPFDPKAKQRRPNPIFSDRRVRQALAMSVNREAMLQNVFSKSGLLSHGPFPMAISAYADSTLRMPPFDTTAAKALLDSAGWRVGSNGVRAKSGQPLRFSIVVPSSSEQRRRYAVLIQGALRKIGVQVDLDQVDGPTAQDRGLKGNFEAILWAFNADPSIVGAKQNWGTAGIGGEGQNFLHYSNKTVDALLDSAGASFDPTKMKKYAARAFQQIVDDAPAIFLYDLSVVRGVNRRIQLATLRTDEWWANLADWSIAPDKRIDRDKVGLQAVTP